MSLYLFFEWCEFCSLFLWWLLFLFIRLFSRESQEKKEELGRQWLLRQWRGHVPWPNRDNRKEKRAEDEKSRETGWQNRELWIPGQYFWSLVTHFGHALTANNECVLSWWRQSAAIIWQAWTRREFIVNTWRYSERLVKLQFGCSESNASYSFP